MAKRQNTLLADTNVTKYVAYYRVSTRAQGDSGLGLEGQRAAVAGFVKGLIVAEYTEVESGKNNQRVQLTAAIDRANREKATLVIAKLDRLSRNASFIFTLRDSGVNFQCVDMPDANTLTIGIFATLAQHERELISSRTKAALQAKIAQGARLGKPENLTPQAQAKGAQANRHKAINNPETRKAEGLAVELRRNKKTYTEIADKLNQFGFKTAQGCQFHPMQVKRLLGRVLVK
ncbi:recombinase family protein [Spirosoma sp. KNUC1025]|uniref:recombinase family protein n=1 Tax=Spirosoma sp. KNUC1025 TaxID=2894082 RepID=UPI001E515229|nr:recombinase family protein [Spirosoma sp. KNUC1025]UFH57714.1 recombinase family protein [Spirosoma sp. KNUC1025]